MILKYLDKKKTTSEQIIELKTFLFFGFPIGYVTVEVIKIIISGWLKYHFSIPNIIFTFIFDLVIFSPFIINYFLHKKRYKDIINKVKNIKEFKVRALFDYKSFVKGQSYTCYFDEMFHSNKFKYYVCTNDGKNCYDYEIELKDVINKFELDDIKEDRLKKLKKLNKKSK